ncbi:hypothetical protein HK405_002952 [Cladochytrium tenue]|nr:hypothetical protein HK405_002952 [Cladochytrium tenue]
MSGPQQPHRSVRRRVAVIGAGASGLPAARHLLARGLDVVVFERQALPGGVWNFDPRAPRDPPYPSEVALQADPPATVPLAALDAAAAIAADGFADRESDCSLEDPSFRRPREAQFDSCFKMGVPGESPPGAFDVESDRPPGACYESLRTNIPTPLMRLKDFDWPTGTPWYAPHVDVMRYLHAYASTFDLGRITRFRTAVVSVTKDHATDEWEVTARAVVSEDASCVKAKWTREIVLVVGNGFSAIDVLLAVAPVAHQVYHSVRPAETNSVSRAHLTARISKSVVQVPNVRAFHVRQAETAAEPAIQDAEIELEDGTRLSGVTRVILCTGYLYSHPFLAQLDDSFIAPASSIAGFDPSSDKPSQSQPLPPITCAGGDHLASLYRDIFYVPDPTLAFVGVSLIVATFSFYEFQAIAVARVWAGEADLPPRDEMLKEVEARFERASTEGGTIISADGKPSLRSAHVVGREGEIRQVAELVAFVNEGAERYGAPLVEGHGATYFDSRARAVEVFEQELKARTSEGSA